MSLWNDIIDVVIGLCKPRCDEAVRRGARLGTRVVLGVMTAILFLWGVGLLIAALFIGLAPRLGASWAAMISAGAAFFAASILALICMMMRR